MEKLALSVVIGGVIASSFNSSIKNSTKSISQIGSEIKKMNKQKVDIKRFRELQKNTQGSRKEFVKLGRSLKESGVDLQNFSRHTSELNKKLLDLKKNALIKGKIAIEKNNIVEQKDSLLATLGTGMAITGVINLRSEVLQAQGELKSLKIGDVGIEKITKEAKNFSNEFAGTTTPQFIKSAYDIKSGISSLGDVAVGKYTRLAAITAGATKSTTEQMTSFFATGYGIYSKQFDELASKTIKGWDKLSQEEKDIKFGETFSAGVSSAVQMYKTTGGEMQSAISTLGAAATTSNVSLAEQLSVLGQLQKTMSGSEAATAYKGFLSGAVEAQEKLGLEFLDSNNQLKSTPKILEELRMKYGETLDDLEKQELKKAFGTEEGMKMINLLYDNVELLEKNTNSLSDSMKKGSETVDEMMKATQQGKGFQLLGQQMANLGATIGKVLYPAVSTLGNVIGGLAVGLDTLITEFPVVSSIIGYTVVGIFSYIAVTKTAKLATIGFRIAKLAFRGTALANIPVMKLLRLSINRFSLATFAATAKTKALSLWTGILGAKSKLAAVGAGVFKVAMMGVNMVLRANPIGLVITAIGALVAGLVWAYNKFDWFKSGVDNAWNTIKTIFTAGASFISNIFTSPIQTIMDMWNGVFNWLASKFDWFGKAVDKIGNIGSKIKNFFGFGGDEEDQNKKTAKNTKSKETDFYIDDEIKKEESIYSKFFKTKETKETENINKDKKVISEVFNKDQNLTTNKFFNTKEKNETENINKSNNITNDVINKDNNITNKEESIYSKFFKTKETKETENINKDKKVISEVFNKDQNLTTNKFFNTKEKNETENINKKLTVGNTLKKATVGAVAATQLAAATPNVEMIKAPEVPQKKEIKQDINISFGDIQLNVTDGKVPDDLQKQIELSVRRAMANIESDRGLSDEDI